MSYSALATTTVIWSSLLSISPPDARHTRKAAKKRSTASGIEVKRT